MLLRGEEDVNRDGSYDLAVVLVVDAVEKMEKEDEGDMNDDSESVLWWWWLWWWR